jgi:hypothetical protein
MPGTHAVTSGEKDVPGRGDFRSRGHASSVRDWGNEAACHLG